VSPPQYVCFMASIVPSLVAGDFARLGESLNVVQSLGVSAVHVDIIDGHFRSQISVGQPVVRSIRKATRLNLDVHLMIERPERYMADFVSAGADSLAFHIEATQDATLAINSMQKLGVKAGLALSCSTPVEACYEVLEALEYVLVETGGGTFMARSFNRVAALAQERKARGLNFDIEVEGNIGVSEAEGLLAAGADILVVGSAIFDKEERGKAMRAFARTLSGGSLAFGQETPFQAH
jgi:ribulose-phosphate 3-epimerase